MQKVKIMLQIHTLMHRHKKSTKKIKSHDMISVLLFIYLFGCAEVCVLAGV